MRPFGISVYCPINRIRIMDNSYQFYIGFNFCQPEPFDGVVYAESNIYLILATTTPCKGAGTNR